MNKTALFITVFSLLFNWHLHGQENEGIIINIDNSNYNENIVNGGAGLAPACGCKKCTCKCVKACFDTTFEATLGAEETITIAPFIQAPTCAVCMGAEQVLDEMTPSITFDVCLETCFQCDGTYSIGYTAIYNIENPQDPILLTVVNPNDTVCVCGDVLSLPAANIASMFLTGNSVNFLLIKCCACDCGCGNCDCNCLNPGEECEIPEGEGFPINPPEML